MSALNDYYANRILDFICKYAPYIIQKAKKLPGNPKQTIRNIISGHIKFETIVCLWHEEELIGVCNFNVKNDVAQVLDCIVHPDYRFKGVLRHLTLLAIQRWPSLEILKFSREKEGNKKPHQILVSKLLKSASLV